LVLRAGLGLVIALGVGVPGVRGQYVTKKLEVSREDYAEAMRERPGIFGAGIIWGGRSTVYTHPDDFNKIMAERVEAAGLQSTRFGFDWAAIEEEPLEYKWEEIEEERNLQGLFDLKLEIYGLITTVPGWASPEHEPGTYGPVDDAEVAEVFEAFCTALAARYKGRIDKWHYGHGQDIDFGWLPKADPESYAKWLKIAYRGLKKGNPDCVVGTGGFMGRNTGFLDKLYGLGLKDFCDAVSICPGPAPPDHAQGDEAFDWKKVEDYRTVMVKHGDERTPVWCPEYGWDVTAIGVEKQGEYMGRTLDYLVSYPYIEMGAYMVTADWHRGDAGLFGLCDKDLGPRPAFEVWTDRVKPLAGIEPRGGTGRAGGVAASQPGRATE
jgi:hypothetical protein